MNWKLDRRNFGIFNLVIAAVFCAALLGFVLPAGAQTLTQTTFDDGTGSIGLPAGWRIDIAYRGNVITVGPNNSSVLLGLPWLVINPDSSLKGLPADCQTPVARTGDIITALREVVKKRGNATLLSVRSAPAESILSGVPAYYLLYNYRQNGVEMTGLGYFTTISSSGTSTWHLYSSAVVAPRAQFPQSAQTMLRMWRSWRPNGQLPREGGSELFDKIIQDSQISHKRIKREFRKKL